MCVILQKKIILAHNLQKKSRASQCRETRKVRLLPCEFVFYEIEYLLLNCLPLICLRGRADDHRVGVRHYFAISPLLLSSSWICLQRTLDLWLSADMDLSREL